MVDSSAKILFQLLRTALGDGTEVSLPEGVDWKAVVDLAFEQGVAALVVDGLQKAGENALLDSDELEDLRYELFGEALACEEDYSKYQQTIEKLASMYGSEGIEMLLLKGYGLSLNYPVPAHRPMGDIDVYLYGRGGAGDALVQKSFGCDVKQNEDKHSIFAIDGITVENHACFVNDSVHPSLKWLNDFLIEEAKSGTRHTIGGSQIVMPSAMFNALFIPFHCAGHFVHGEASVRQLCDWVCFVQKHSSEIDWNVVESKAKEAGFWRFYCCLNGIVQEHLGVSSPLLPEWPRDRELEARVIEEILAPRKVVKSLLGKVYRFFASGWKYRMVYDDSMFASSFRLAKSYLRLKNHGAESIWEKG